MTDKFEDIEKIEKVNLNINLKDLQDIYCLDCAELYPEDDLQNIFAQRYIVKKLSAVQSPDGKPKIIPMPIFVCAKCGNMVDFETWENKFNK